MRKDVMRCHLARALRAAARRIDTKAPATLTMDGRKLVAVLEPYMAPKPRSIVKADGTRHWIGEPFVPRPDETPE